MALKYKIAAITVAALFVDLLDLTIVNIAIPAIRDDFGVSIAQVQWAVTAYVLAVAIAMPASGWASDRFGSKRVFLSALALFTVGSALCAAAWNVNTLIACRALQGIGGGLLVPVGMAILFRAFSESERAKASAIFSVPAAMAPAIGPLAGSVFVDTVGWRWVLLINVPVGVIASVLGARLLDDYRVPNVGSFDVRGWFTGAGGVALLALALSNASEGSSVRMGVVLPFAIAVLLLAVFLRVETSTTTPMVDLSLFRRRSFAMGNATMFLASAGFGGLLFALPLFLQGPIGLNVHSTGLVMACHAIGIMGATVFGPKLLRLAGTRICLTLGLVGCAVGTGLFAHLSPTTPQPTIAVILLAAGASFGLLIVPLQTVPFEGMVDHSLTQGTAILSIGRQIGIALGTAAVTVPLTAMADSGFEEAFLLAAAFILIALPAAFRMKPSIETSSSTSEASTTPPVSPAPNRT